MFAACALWAHGDPPLVMHLDCHESDYPHVIALFRRHGAWGALSKTNGAPLRYRDPIYRSLRELALSYFHEYSNRRGHKTLRSYSVAFDLRRLALAEDTNTKSCGSRTTGSGAAPLSADLQRKDAAREARCLRAQGLNPSRPRPELGCRANGVGGAGAAGSSCAGSPPATSCPGPSLKPTPR